MKALKIILFGMSLALLLISCGQSEEEKALTDAIYMKYKSDAIDTNTSVPFNILNLEIEDEQKSNDSVYYRVNFLIQEMYPSRRNYYDGNGTVLRVGNKYEVKYYDYHTSSKYN